MFSAGRTDIAHLLREAEQHLAQSDNSSDTPRLDAEVLLCDVLNVSRSYLFTWPEKQLDTQQLQQFSKAIEKRVKGEPVAYITGSREFWSLQLQVSEATLIPRADTETLVDIALQLGRDMSAQKKQRLHVLDLGAGTGAIALALAVEQPDWHITALDKSADAVKLAEKNRQMLSLSNVSILQSDWFTAISGQYDLIVSNPPYIDAEDPHLQQGDVRFEPHSALVAEQQGLKDLHDIIAQARCYLNNGGWLAVEHGYQQSRQVASLFEKFGYTALSTKQDLAGQDRVTCACWVTD